ncbi:hypothetical protein ACLQ22_09720 [Micromonospora sp. DT178]|uniref:hypothetical protein n=1 Tax=Micromonospora sp. DT178 TaxID=3393436 RepID=UPI003CED2008
MPPTIFLIAWQASVTSRQVRSGSATPALARRAMFGEEPSGVPRPPGQASRIANVMAAPHELTGAMHDVLTGAAEPGPSDAGTPARAR